MTYLTRQLGWLARPVVSGTQQNESLGWSANLLLASLTKSPRSALQHMGPDKLDSSPNHNTTSIHTPCVLSLYIGQMLSSKSHGIP